MVTGADLVAEGTEVKIKGGQTARLLFDMFSFVKLEEEFGGLGGVQGLFPSGDLKPGDIPADMFTKLVKILHLGFLHLGWTFEQTCHNLLPRHLQSYFEALAAELNFEGEASDGAAPKA